MMVITNTTKHAMIMVTGISTAGMMVAREDVELIKDEKRRVSSRTMLIW